MSEFDKITHKRDSKGNINLENHYVLRITNGEQKFERPPKSGIFYGPDGKLLNASAATDEMVSKLLPEVPKTEVSVQKQDTSAKSK